MGTAEGAAAEKAADVIGVGPEGRLAGLIQFVVLGIVLTAIFIYGFSPATIIMTLLPASLIMLIAMGHLVLIGDSFPFAPPGGNWTPAVSRFQTGVKMTLIWAAATAIFLCFMLYIYPGWPMSPLYLWWGAIGFWLTLLYGINWNTWPFKGKMHPWGTMIVAFAVVMVLTALIWNFLTNLDGTPLANTPMNHKGPLNVNWLTGYIVWAIAWIFILSPVFTTQGWPFAGLGHPGMAIAQTIAAHILAYICWAGSLALGMSPSFSFGAVGSSIIFWAIVYGWHVQFWGVTKLTGGSRAIAAFVVQCVLTALWIALLRVVLAPAADAIAAAKLPADVNILIIYLNLCILATVLIAHNALWLRWPLTLPNPPGTPPPDVSAP
jgi:hypothetical protein